MIHTRALVWSAFRQGGFVSVSAAPCRRASTGVTLVFCFRSYVSAVRFFRRWYGLRPLMGVRSVLVPVDGCVPFRTDVVAVRGLQSLDAVAIKAECLLL